MKIMRILLIAAFMLALVSAPAQAQEAQAAARGYVVLVNDTNLNMPLYTQSRMAFDRLAPRLLAAQKSGAISAFYPDLQAGFVQINFAPGADISALDLGSSIYTDLHEVIARVRSFAPTRQDADLQAAAGPIFYMSINSNCFDVSGLFPGTHVVGTLRDAAGRAVSFFEGDEEGGGYLTGCFYAGSHNVLLPGYSVIFKTYTSTGVYLARYTSGVPALTFTSVSNINSIVGGRGPANQPYYIQWYHAKMDAGNTYLSPTLSGVFSATGTWSKDFGTVPFRGGDDINLYKTAGNFRYSRWFTVPYSYCELASNYCGMYDFPNQDTWLAIVHAGTTKSFTGRTSRSGWFGAELLDANGNPIDLLPGDGMYNKTNPTKWTLVPMSAAINYTTDVVSGKGPANKYFYVIAKMMFQSPVQNSVRVKSDTLGNYVANFVNRVDFKPTSAYAVEINFQNPVTGNIQSKLTTFGP